MQNLELFFFFVTFCPLNYLDHFNQRIIHCCQALIAENLQWQKNLFYYADTCKSPSRGKFRAVQSKDWKATTEHTHDLMQLGLATTGRESLSSHPKMR